MTLWQPRAGSIEISGVVRGLVERREQYWALRGINAKFSMSDRRMIERAMMDHRHETADRMLGVAAFVVTQIEKPWREMALAGGNA